MHLSPLQEIARFLRNPRKPAILAMSRPDAKKNITTLVKAFGENSTLRELANLVLIMVSAMDVNNVCDGHTFRELPRSAPDQVEQCGPAILVALGPACWNSTGAFGEDGAPCGRWPTWCSSRCRQCKSTGHSIAALAIYR